MQTKLQLDMATRIINPRLQVYGVCNRSVDCNLCPGGLWIRCIGCFSLIKQLTMDWLLPKLPKINSSTHLW